MTPTQILLLNGAGSSGKTSLARALQTRLGSAFLHVQMDMFLDMLPARYMNDPAGFTFSSFVEDGKDVVSIQSGPIARRAMEGMRHAIVALANQGNNLIVDEVLLGDEKAEYARLLAPFKVSMVGVHCPLDVLEERERQRGDRLIGLARWQYDKVHANVAYDVMVDTSKATPEECALLVIHALALRGD
ncbi:chloramphenicol phosphotransferase CPT family protein [Burkholderia ambifaria]|jgi:chloramphenicol 3-O phosphotransferase|uniref:chloramphenicol phosphotransferase CPT family protein n=1 Tax=Burkholderia TaxID=32008 RepID=UPI00158F1AC3|nr:AAA family ATPase [Burkholderia ambifaria]MBR8348042.1 AAA family ATPase [Burkholderia ambifaria]